MTMVFSNAFRVVVIALVFVAAEGAVARAEWVAVQDYDATSNSNTVDGSATSSSNNTKELSLNEFTPLLASAYATGNGGVIDFDSYTTEEQFYTGGHPGQELLADTMDEDYLYATFDGGNKSITIGGATNDFAGMEWSGSNRTAISGSYMLGNHAFYGGADLGFGAITGGDSEEYVTACGLTLLSNGGSDASTFGVTAYFSDGTSISEQAELLRSNGGDDTFFGFVAPEGMYITKVEVRYVSGNSSYRTAIEDIAFVTTAVPEPASGALSLLAAIASGAAFWKRRRRC